MAVVSSPRRHKSWQIADEIVSLVDVLAEKGDSLGERLRRLSRAAGFTSDEEAARAIPMSYRQYQRYLSGESEPRASTLQQIALAFGTSLPELVGMPDEDQLDRIEGKLDRVLHLLSGEEADGAPAPSGLVADAVAPLEEVAGSPPRAARERPRSPRAAPRRTSA